MAFVRVHGSDSCSIAVNFGDIRNYNIKPIRILTN